jgi:hypothetical protein
MHRLWTPLVVSLLSLAVGASATEPPSPPIPPQRWVKILDPAVDLTERRKLLADAEADASTDDPHGLYVLGAIYDRGGRAGSVLAQRDPDKASLYFGNAALHGDVSAMASLAELKLGKHDYREAMNWAQIYAHYQPRDKRAMTQGSYMAELVKRIGDKLGANAMPDVMRDVDSFIAKNDATILGGMMQGSSCGAVPTTSPNANAVTPSGRLTPLGGMAAFLVTFAPDGKVSDAFLVDAVPGDDIIPMLRKRVTGMVAPVGTQPMRCTWVQMVFSSGRYR